jgi:hypothetical protein
MSLQFIVGELRRVPWGWLLVVVLVVFFVWRLCKHHYAKEWLRWAPEKAKDEVLRMRREMGELQRAYRRMAAANARLRARIEAARVGLDTHQELELVEGRA